jgi:hypothetical protein
MAEASSESMALAIVEAKGEFFFNDDVRAAIQQPDFSRYSIRPARWCRGGHGSRKQQRDRGHRQLNGWMEAQQVQ